MDAIYPVSVIHVSLKQDRLLDQHHNSLVKDYINSKLANVSYEDKPHDFLRFVGHFGTHMIQEAELGGALRFSAEVECKAKTEMSKAELIEESDASIKLFLKKHGATISDIPEGDPKFLDASTTSIT